MNQAAKLFETKKKRWIAKQTVVLVSTQTQALTHPLPPYVQSLRYLSTSRVRTTNAIKYYRERDGISRIVARKGQTSGVSSVILVCRWLLSVDPFATPVAAPAISRAAWSSVYCGTANVVFFFIFFLFFFLFSPLVFSPEPHGHGWARMGTAPLDFFAVAEIYSKSRAKALTRLCMMDGNFCSPAERYRWKIARGMEAVIPRFLFCSLLFLTQARVRRYVGVRTWTMCLCVCFSSSFFSFFSFFFFFFWWGFYRAKHADTLIAKVSGCLFDTERTRINWILISCLFICPISYRTKMLDDVRTRCFTFAAE